MGSMTWKNLATHYALISYDRGIQARVTRDPLSSHWIVQARNRAGGWNYGNATTKNAAMRLARHMLREEQI